MSWKVKGVNLEKTNNIFVNCLSANYFTLKHDYEGHLTINGTFLVNKASHFRSNVIVDGNLYVASNVVANSSIRIGNDAQIGKSLSVDGNAIVSGNVLIRGNLRIMQNYVIEKLLFVNGKSIHLGADETVNPIVYGVNLYSNGPNLGINKSGAIYGLDIECNAKEAMRVASTGDSCTNILSTNKFDSSIVASTLINESDIELRNSYNTVHFKNKSNNGLVVSSANAIKLESDKVSVGLESKGSKCTIYGSRLIHPIGEPNTALSLMPDIGSEDAIAAELRSLSGHGLIISGGCDKETKTKAVATLGLRLTDQQGMHTGTINVQTIVASSQNSSKNKFTMGLNTVSPAIDTCVLDVNGPIHVAHEEVSVVYEDNSNIINKIIFGTKVGCRNVGVILTTTDYFIIYTIDGGNTWKTSSDMVSTNANIALQLRCAVVYSDKMAILGGDFGLLMYTIDGFQTWHRVSGMLFSESITSVSVCLKDSLYVVCFIYGSNTLGYFTLPSLNVLALTNTSLGGNREFILDAQSIGGTNQFTDGRSFFYGNKPNASAFVPSQQFFDMVYDDNENILTIVGTDAIHTLSLNVANTSNIFTYNSNRVSGAYVATAANVNGIAKRGTASVGSNKIVMYNHVYTIDFSDVILNDIYVKGDDMAIAVGNKGAIYVTYDAGYTWSNIVIKNVSYDKYKLKNVAMTDDNTLILLVQDTVVMQQKIIKCHVPELFNHGNYTIMTIVGNTLVSGTSQTENMNVIKDVAVGGNTTMAENLSVAKTITTDSLFCANINGVRGLALTIGNGYASQLFIKGNANLNQCFINNDLSVSGTIRASSIRSLSGNLSLGKNDSVRIVEHSDGYPNDVYLGNSTDNVMIRGNNLVIQGGISTVQNQIQLRTNATDINGSAGAGLLIRDNGDNLSGFIRINSTIDGYELKATAMANKSNILNIRVSELRLDNKFDSISGLPMQTGLVVLRSTPLVYGDADRSGYTMTSAAFDVQNIILGNYAHAASGQTIDTDLFVTGKILFENTSDIYSYNGTSASLQVNGGASIKKNVYVRGNLYSARSYLEQSALSAGTTVRDRFDALGPAFFSGNATTFDNSNIFFLGNIDSRATSTFRGNVSMLGAASFSGNVSVLSNTTVRRLQVDENSIFSGNVTCAGAFLATNIENINVNNYGLVPTDIAGAVRIAGGMAVHKDASVRGSLLLCMDNIVQILPVSSNMSMFAVSTSTQLQSVTSYQSKTFVVTSSDASYKNGSYVITSGSMSSPNNYENTFDNLSTAQQYWSGSGYPASNGGRYSFSLSQTLLDGNPFYGEFLQIQLPFQCSVYSYSVLPDLAFAFGTPSSWILCASKNGTSFFELDTVVDKDITNSTQQSNLISYEKCKSYSFFRYIITKVTRASNNTSDFSLRQISLLGYVQSAISTKALLCAGPATIFGNTALCGVTTVKNSTIATNSSTGAMIVAGDMGVSGNAFISNMVVEKGLRLMGNATLDGSLQLAGSLTVLGKYNFDLMKIDGTAPSTSLTTGTLLLPGGGASIGGNVYVGQNTVVFGNSSVDKEMRVTGNIAALSNVQVTGNAVVSTLFGNVVSSNIIVNEGGQFTCNGIFSVKTFNFNSNIESTSATTGSLLVVGGVGVTGNISVGKNINVAANIIVATNGSITSPEVNAGKITVTGLMSISTLGSLDVAGNTVLTYATVKNNLTLSSTNTTTSIDSGSLIIKGGGGITGNCHVGGSMIIYGGIASQNQGTSWTYPILQYPVTTTTTGATFAGVVPQNSATAVFPSNLILSGAAYTVGSSTDRTWILYYATFPKCQLSWLTVTSQNFLLSYKNGTYAALTSMPAFVEGGTGVSYYGCNVFVENNTTPWISTYTYYNTTGLPATISMDLRTSDANLYNGEFIILELRYRQRMTSYTITFRNTDPGAVAIESYPTSWQVIGIKPNDIFLYQIEGQNDIILAALEKKRTFTFNASVDTSVYAMIAILITKVKPNTTTDRGVCLTGLYCISFAGTPMVTIAATPPNSATSTTTSLVTYNENLTSPTSFSGASTTITFGDATTYGNVNVFKDINIVGNINCPLHSMTINSDIIVKEKVSAATFATTSDYRIKSNVASLTEEYNVDRLNPVSYYNALTKRNDIGLLAHELQELYPALVFGDKDDTNYQSINYASLISILIKEVKELKIKIKALM